MLRTLILTALMSASSCSSTPATFGDDLAFLREHVEVVLLEDGSGAQVAVVPEYQARVMTSSTTGGEGLSLGWVHRKVVATGERQPQITVVGGSDRIWVGPEGGQFSIYHDPGAPFELSAWRCPEVIDWGGWPITERTDRSVAFRKEAKLRNWSGTGFELELEREVTLLRRDAMADVFGVPAPTGVRTVGVRTRNAITNTGGEAWTQDKGLLSLWIIGMFPPSDDAVVVVPLKPGEDGKVFVEDTYFGKVPFNRLSVNRMKNVAWFRADGQHRSKIGVPHAHAREVCGAWDSGRGVLTIVRTEIPEVAASGYVNSLWVHQERPFAGDVINIYNDGPPEEGADVLGPFFELETSSPALALSPGQKGEHIHETWHLTGDRGGLDRVAQAVLGVGLSEFEAAFE